MSPAIFAIAFIIGFAIGFGIGKIVTSLRRFNNDAPIN